MDWTAAVDGYCERLGPAFWAEPVNAATNAAFLIAALWVWRGARGIERVLAVVLFAIGVGSFLFHTLAQAWAGLADVLPILLFILLYVYAANRHFWGWPAWASALGAAAFVPYAVVLGRVFALVPGLGGSAAYAPVPLLIYAYALALRRRAPATARGLAVGATILVASLTARTLDAPLCEAIPLGTHFLWHVLNAIMLGWMIVVLRRHRLAGGAAGR
ncbi:ceramidase domain-containing protein [Citreimonas sp.]|uniref:ceramidase domain-containing protein n=1 Tax=Citreimonas sp. TaxID=3036715 RepID=UPI00405A368E